MKGDTTNLWEIPISHAGRVTGPAQRHTLTALVDLHASVIPGQTGSASRMLFSSLAGNVNVWSLPIDANDGRVTGEMVNLTQGISYAAAPSISADGTKLVFIAVRSTIWSVKTRDLETGKETTVTRADARWLRPRISPDGVTVAYVDNHDDIYMVNNLTGMTEKICEHCGPPTDVSAGGQQVLFEPLDPPDYVMWIDVPRHRTAPMIRPEEPDHILYGGRLAPGGLWVAFHAALDKSLNKKIFISPVQDGRGVPEAEWIPVTDGSHVDLNASWSPDGNLLYFLSERDGFRCIWGQRLQPDTKRPIGDAFAVQHFHYPRQSLARVERADLIGLSAARGRLVFAMSELRGNIWMEERKITTELGWFRRWMPVTFR
jgi:eukaryotic-like serine/threonine-protein kinase